MRIAQVIDHSLATCNMYHVITMFLWYIPLYIVLLSSTPDTGDVVYVHVLTPRLSLTFRCSVYIVIYIYMYSALCGFVSILGMFHVLCVIYTHPYIIYQCSYIAVCNQCNN